MLRLPFSRILAWLCALGLLCILGCSLDRNGIGTFVLADGQVHDASLDCNAIGDGAEDGHPSDAGNVCVPANEVCNARDDNCDSNVDERGCEPCTAKIFAGKTYLFCGNHLDWPSARSWCTERGYDLVKLETMEEDRWVWKEAKAIQQVDWWLGMSDLDTEAVYLWIDGTLAWANGAPIGYANWRDQRPEDMADQDCIQFDVGASDGQWADHTCGSTLPFVCEVKN